MNSLPNKSASSSKNTRILVIIHNLSFYPGIQVIKEFFGMRHPLLAQNFLFAPQHYLYWRDK